MLRPAFTANTFSYYTTLRMPSHVLWPDVPTETPDSLSNVSFIHSECAALVSASWATMLVLISLNSVLTCLLWRSQGTLYPRPPWVFTKRFHFIWLQVEDASCSFKLSASSAYLVHRAAWEWSKIPQQWMIHSPSPSRQASVNSRAKEAKWQT